MLHLGCTRIAGGRTKEDDESDSSNGASCTGGHSPFVALPAWFRAGGWRIVRVMRAARLLFALAIAGLLAACADDPTPLFGGGQDPANTWPGATVCLETARPTVCRREYRPVCARSGSGERRTYANGCEACLDPSVADHRPGACKVK